MVRLINTTILQTWKRVSLSALAGAAMLGLVGELPVWSAEIDGFKAEPFRKIASGRHAQWGGLAIFGSEQSRGVVAGRRPGPGATSELTSYQPIPGANDVFADTITALDGPVWSEAGHFSGPNRDELLVYLQNSGITLVSVDQKAELPFIDNPNWKCSFPFPVTKAYLPHSKAHDFFGAGRQAIVIGPSRFADHLRMVGYDPEKGEIVASDLIHVQGQGRISALIAGDFSGNGVSEVGYLIQPPDADYELRMFEVLAGSVGGEIEVTSPVTVLRLPDLVAELAGVVGGETADELSFSSAEAIAYEKPVGMRSGDLSGDGRMELVLPVLGGGRAILVAVQPSPQIHGGAIDTVVLRFEVIDILDLPEGASLCMTLDDLNRDGREELIVGTGDGRVAVYYRAAPGFDPTGRASVDEGNAYLRHDLPGIETGEGILEIVSGDVDGDSVRDIYALTSPASPGGTSGLWAARLKINSAADRNAWVQYR